jgi:hypothetical protein
VTILLGFFLLVLGLLWRAVGKSHDLGRDRAPWQQGFGVYIWRVAPLIFIAGALFVVLYGMVRLLSRV